MGRAPCCDKANVKKGPWSPEEDAKLKSYIEQHGTGGNWIALPQKIGLKRCGKSCRLRWLNYLRPNIKHGGFSEEEDNIICSLYLSIGSRWSVIAGQLPGRTDNDIKNYWNTRLKKKLLGKQKQRKEQQARINNKAGNGVVKRETNNGRNSIPENSTQQHQQPYIWQQQPQIMPVLPSLPYINQGPSFNDQDSIRRLLVKLGGRFSDDNYQHQHQPIIDHDGFNFQLQDGFQQVDHIGSSCSMNSINNKQVQLTSESQTNNYQLGISELVQGEGSSFTEAIGEMGSTNDCPQKWLEFLYGEDDNNEIIMCPTSCGQSSNWGGEISSSSSLIYPPLVASNYQEIQTQDQCVFHGEL